MEVAARPPLMTRVARRQTNAGHGSRKTNRCCPVDAVRQLHILHDILVTVVVFPQLLLLLVDYPFADVLLRRLGIPSVVVWRIGDLLSSRVACGQQLVCCCHQCRLFRRRQTVDDRSQAFCNGQCQ